MLGESAAQLRTNTASADERVEAVFRRIFHAENRTGEG